MGSSQWADLEQGVRLGGSPHWPGGRPGAGGGAPEVVEEVLQHVEHVRRHVVEAHRRVTAAHSPVRLAWGATDMASLLLRIGKTTRLLCVSLIGHIKSVNQLFVTSAYLL